MTDGSVDNFNKRHPQRPPAEEPRKRSNHIALLVMGTMAVGGGAYALMPSEKCDPDRPSIEQPGCRVSNSSSSSSSGGHYYGGSSDNRSGSAARSNFVNSSSSGANAGGSSSPWSVARSGFGSFGSHFSGGG